MVKPRELSPLQLSLAYLANQAPDQWLEQAAASTSRRLQMSSATPMLTENTQYIRSRLVLSQLTKRRESGFSVQWAVVLAIRLPIQCR